VAQRVRLRPSRLVARPDQPVTRFRPTTTGENRKRFLFFKLLVFINSNSFDPNSNLNEVRLLYVKKY
jgi:hypothetical protein